MKKYPPCFTIIFLFTVLLLLVRCGKPAPDQSLFDTLYEEAPVKLTIETNLAAITQGKDTSSFQPAVISFKKNACKAINFEGEVKPRGVFRKKNCDFPPLKLKLGKSDLEAQNLKQYNTFKLVTPCREDYDFEQFVLKEYLAFRLYNVLTDRSFRVQLASIRHVDSQKKLPETERYGFLIEDDDELASRLGGQIIGEETGPPKTIDKEQYKIFTLFQFMIGNTDWSLNNRHNALLIQPEHINTPMPFPVPYDFDFCGMVGAPYAQPPGHLPIKSVKERIFQWRGGQNEDLTPTFALFSSKREELIRTCQDFELLHNDSKAEVLAYLNSFFDMLESPDQIVGKN